MVRKAVCPYVQFHIAQCDLSERHRHSFRSLRHLLLEQLMQAFLNEETGLSSIPGVYNLPPLLFGQHRQEPYRSFFARIDHPLEQSDVITCITLDGSTLKQRSGVFECADDAISCLLH